MTTASKTCFKCQRTQPITEFYVHPAMGDGRLNKCKTCTRADVKANREANADYYREYDRERGWRPPEPEKIRAHNAVRVLQRKPCEVCGAEKAEAHHDDYSKPLDVRWLCKKHHAEHHRKSA